MSTVQPQQDGYLTVQLQVGQLFESETWISYSPELKTIAHGDTQDSSLANLCEQVEEVGKFCQETGRVPSFQTNNIEGSLQAYPYHKAIVVTVPGSVKAC